MQNVLGRLKVAMSGVRKFNMFLQPWIGSNWSKFGLYWWELRGKFEWIELNWGELCWIGVYLEWIVLNWVKLSWIGWIWLNLVELGYVLMYWPVCWVFLEILSHLKFVKMVTRVKQAGINLEMLSHLKIPCIR